MATVLWLLQLTTFGPNLPQCKKCTAKLLKNSQMLLQGLTKHFHLLRLLQRFLRDPARQQQDDLTRSGHHHHCKLCGLIVFCKRIALFQFAGPPPTPTSPAPPASPPAARGRRRTLSGRRCSARSTLPYSTRRSRGTYVELKNRVLFLVKSILFLKNMFLLRCPKSCNRRVYDLHVQTVEFF